MAAWCRSPDGQAAIVEIEREMKTRGWDQLGQTSSKDRLHIVCSDRSGVDGVLGRLLCEKEVNFFLKSAIPIYHVSPTFLVDRERRKPEDLQIGDKR